MRIQEILPQGNILFPEEYYTSQNLYFRIEEYIREKVFLHMQEEIPHSSYVHVEEVDDREDICNIQAYIYVETDSQKYIMIGKSGSNITRIGKQSRRDLEDLLGKKVFLSLRVKVRKNWRKDSKLLARMFSQV